MENLHKNLTHKTIVICILLLASSIPTAASFKKDINQILEETREIVRTNDSISNTVKRFEKTLSPTDIQDINTIYGSTNTKHLDFGSGENDRIAAREEARAKAQGKWHQFGNMLAQSLLTENVLGVIDLFSFGKLNEYVKELRVEFCEKTAPIHRIYNKPDEWGWYMQELPNHLATVLFATPGYWLCQYFAASIEAIKSSM